MNRFPSYLAVYGRMAIFLEAYGVKDAQGPEFYLNEYFRRGGTKDQLVAYTSGIPVVEAQALASLLKSFSRRDTDFQL